MITDYLIPVAAGHAVTPGWPTRGLSGEPAPLGVTWHWTAGGSIAGCRATIGGANPQRKGEASAHYAVGRGAAHKEGIDRYVTLDNRSWHAQKHQTLDLNGDSERVTGLTGIRSCVGVEVVHPGYARPAAGGLPAVLAGDGAVEVATPDGKTVYQVPAWSDEQIQLCIEVGREIVKRFPNIRPEHHHGHVDLCPGYKADPLGMPLHRVLHGIYAEEHSINCPEEWECWWRGYLTVTQRQIALRVVGCRAPGSPDGYYVGEPDGIWGPRSDRALRAFQADHNLVVNGLWTVHTARAIYALTDEWDRP